MVECCQPPSLGLASDNDEPSTRSEGLTDVGQSAVAADVQDGVIALLVVGGIVAGVVNDAIGAEVPTRSILAELHTAVTSAPRALGDLDGECAYATRGANDQNLLPGLHAGAITDTLQLGDPGNRYRRRLL